MKRTVIVLGLVAALAATVWMTSSGSRRTSNAGKREASAEDRARREAEHAREEAEHRARSLAAQGIEAHPPETQQRFYQAHLRSQEQGVTTLTELIHELETARSEIRDASQRAEIDKQLEANKAQLEGRQQRIADLQEKLATLH